MVKINGSSMEMAGITLAQYLSTTDYAISRIAVEKNGMIVPKSQYETTLLCDGDELEIVSFVGGG